MPHPEHGSVAKAAAVCSFQIAFKRAPPRLPRLAPAAGTATPSMPLPLPALHREYSSRQHVNLLKLIMRGHKQLSLHCTSVPALSF